MGIEGHTHSVPWTLYFQVSVVLITTVVSVIYILTFSFSMMQLEMQSLVVSCVVSCWKDTKSER